MARIRLMSHNQWKCDSNLPVWEEQGLDCSADVRERGFVRVIRCAFEHGFVHAHDAAVEFADETQGYHSCGVTGFRPYRNDGFKAAIDHILVRRFERFSPDYYLPLSDHSPVFIDVEL